MDKREEIKQKIISATIECIEEFGISGTTTRKISETAEVNISAISYYFQGRDNLINLAFETTMNNAFNIDDIEIKKDYSYSSVLKIFLEDWFQGALAYPNIARAHIDSIVNSKPQGTIIVNEMDAFLKKVYNILVEHNMPDNASQYNKLNIVFSALFGHILMSDFKGNKDLDKNFIELLSDYI